MAWRGIEIGRWIGRIVTWDGLLVVAGTLDGVGMEWFNQAEVECIDCLWDRSIVGAEMDWEGNGVIRVGAQAWDALQQYEPEYLKTAAICQFFLYVLPRHFE